MTESRESEQIVNRVTEYHLPQGRMLRIQRAEGWVLHCERGAVHITQQGDARDIVLSAGAVQVLDTNGRVVVDAHGDARLKLVPPATERKGWRGLFSARKFTLPVSPVVRLLAARRHGTDPAPGAPLTYDAVFRTQPDGTRLFETLVARAHRERSEKMVSVFTAVMAAALNTLVRAVMKAVRMLKACLRLQLPSIAETFAARVFLRARTWH